MYLKKYCFKFICYKTISLSRIVICHAFVSMKITCYHLLDERSVRKYTMSSSLCMCIQSCWLSSCELWRQSLLNFWNFGVLFVPTLAKSRIKSKKPFQCLTKILKAENLDFLHMVQIAIKPEVPVLFVCTNQMKFKWIFSLTASTVIL